MIQDIVERLRYRFELWTRGDPPYFGVPSRANEMESKLASDPKRKVVLTERTVMFIARVFISYFVPVGVVAIICRVFIAFFPSARHGIIIGFFVLACIWAVGAVRVIANLSSARRDYQNEDTDHLTNR
jgi:hypothetical protein